LGWNVKSEFGRERRRIDLRVAEGLKKIIKKAAVTYPVFNSFIPVREIFHREFLALLTPNL